MDLPASLTALLRLVQESKFLAAKQLYNQMREGSSAADFDAAILPHKAALDLMIERAEEILSTLDSRDHEGVPWIVASHLFGIVTKYRPCPDDNSIIIKLEGQMDDLPLFESCVVLNEADLFNHWLPLCSESKLIEKLGYAETVPYINIGLPVMSRDFLLRCYAADCLEEHGKVVIVGRSWSDYSNREVPWKPKGWFHDKLIVKELKMIVDLVSSTSAKTTIVAHVDPQMALPQGMINFFMKNFAGVLLYLFQRQVIRVQKEMSQEYLDRIHRDKDFYERWFLPKLRNYCKLKGWEPPHIPLFPEPGEQVK